MMLVPFARTRRTHEWCIQLGIALRKVISITKDGQRVACSLIRTSDDICESSQPKPYSRHKAICDSNLLHCVVACEKNEMD